MILAIIITVIIIVILLIFRSGIRHDDGDLQFFTFLSIGLIVLIWVGVLINKNKKPNPPQVEEIAQQVEETTKGGYEIIDYVLPDKWNNHFTMIRNESEMYKASKWWKDNGFSFKENRIIEYPLYVGVIDGKLEYVNDDRLKSLNNVKLIKLK